MDNTDNSPEEEKAIKKKKEDDSNVILNMLVVNKKAKLKACAGFKSTKLTRVCIYIMHIAVAVATATLIFASKYRICHRASCW